MYNLLCTNVLLLLLLNDSKDMTTSHASLTLDSFEPNLCMYIQYSVCTVLVL